MNLFYAAQILGGIAVVIQIFTYQQNTRKHILFGVMSAQILFVVHFLFLGAYTGAAVNAVGASRNFIFGKSKKIIKSSHLLWGFLLVQLIVSLLTWGGPISCFALVGAWFSTFAFWQSEPKDIRRFIVFMPLCWLVYNYFLHSYVGMVSNTFVLISTLAAMYRFDFAPKTSREKIV